MSDIEMLGWATFAVYTIVRVVPFACRAALANRAARAIKSHR